MSNLQRSERFIAFAALHAHRGWTIEQLLAVWQVQGGM